MQAPPAASTGTTEIVWHDRRYRARAIAGGAAFELYADTREPGFQPSGKTFHRYVHASEVESSGGELLLAGVAPVSVPVMPGADAATVHRYSQNPRIGPAERALVSAVRTTAFVNTGTRMVKPLSRHQVAKQLTAAPLVSGVCFREFDVAHLRAPEDRIVLSGDPDDVRDTSFTLRWKAIAACDYTSTEASHYPGLVGIPGRERRGSMILGTGFLPSGTHLIPEFTTAGLADLPLTARAEILAYTADGAEIALFQYQPQTNVWNRMAGARHRDLVNRIPGLETGRALFRVDPSVHAGLVGDHEGQRVPVTADPGHGFNAYTRGAVSRSPVTHPQRFYTRARWRDVEVLALGRNEDWVRLRLSQPDIEAIMSTDATCVERGVYECWAPLGELENPHTVTINYPTAENPAAS
ncbi:hypothetical protein [Glycomyces harbinensis]|uniref:Uncharacterized protein n=1 Tax=Glycomyces harbinensis TaxID=58114 RepID=A0A1G6SY70_9ACTN|nr:hypothetical protein [Glycomyces harbinensis]SDD21554.1 hypothetical protein SAMN05216270_102357 [Glycomyces harbinensis]